MEFDVDFVSVDGGAGVPLGVLKEPAIVINGGRAMRNSLYVIRDINHFWKVKQLDDGFASTGLVESSGDVTTRFHARHLALARVILLRTVLQS